jgi:hypothetical protein
LFNVVNVESVPLKSDEFSACRATEREIVGHAGDMRVALVPVIVAGIALLAPPSAGASTDEDQVRAVLTGMNTSYNRTDFGSFATHLCSNMLKAAGFEAGWYASRKSDGATQIIINSIDVTGGSHAQAVANVRFQAANHQDPKTLDVEFLRQGAEWKACRYSVGRYI